VEIRRIAPHIEEVPMRCLPLLAAALLVACAHRGAPPPAAPTTGATGGEPLRVAPDLERRVRQFAATPLSADLGALPDSERRALAELIAAGRVMDDIFLSQVWEGNGGMRERLTEVDAALAPLAVEYFAINFGPWDRLAEDEPFLGDRPKPPGAGFYPQDLTKPAAEAWLQSHPDQAEAFRSGFTVVRRDGGGELRMVPYSEEYRQPLARAAEHLRRAAAATGNASLRRFLELRAAAFASDDYYESDLAWMDLDAPVEVTIGPYETYEDGLFGYKTSFEAFVTVALPEESAKLAGYKAELPWLERNLPIPDEHKNLDRGTESPIRVVDLVFSGGETKAGVQTVAFNLPNDERVREAKGSKKVLLHNVLRAKYDQILQPIAQRTLAADQLPHLSFDAFFDEVLHHELAHGLGPGRITVDGKPTEVRLALQELYSPLEEAKADVMGVWNIFALVDRGKMPRELLDTLPATYLAGLFRSARFGVHEAHGRGVVSQFSYLQEKGALTVDGEGRFRIVGELFRPAIRDLLHDYLMLQARGDYAATTTFLDRYGKPSAELLAAIERLVEVPVDIRPVYPLASELAPAP
jgi:hypothetical protein